ncbi:MAG: DUF4867 family protein [Eubacteriales bacterium]|nr:DUF4867 family protein [Eubacteriales bacterium]
MKLYSIDNAAFRPYGRVISGYDTAELHRTLEAATPLPEGVVYTLEQPELQRLPVTQQLRDRLYGGMPIQMGWCNGHNTKLNCLEYHRDSEINFGTESFLLLLGKQEQIGADGMFDTADIRAFRVPADTLVELYATTLHYAPCSDGAGKGFRVLVVLPQGTNAQKPDIVPGNHEDTLLTARNKWLLAHPDSDEARQGAAIGLKGKNIDISDLVE